MCGTEDFSTQSNLNCPTAKSPAHRSKKISTDKIYRSKKASAEMERTCKSVKSLINKYNAISRSDDDSSEPVSDQIINSIKSHASARSRIPSFLDYKSREPKRSDERGQEADSQAGVGGAVAVVDGEASKRDKSQSNLSYIPSAFDSHLYNMNDLQDFRSRTRHSRRSYSRFKVRWGLQAFLLLKLHVVALTLCRIFKHLPSIIH